MKKWALLLGLFGWGVLGQARMVSASGPPAKEERATRVRLIQREVTDLETIGRAKVLQARGAKPLLRPAVTSAYNVEKFTPVMARFVRFNVQATVSGDEPCLDAFELYGPDGKANLTETKGVRLTASSIWPGHLGDFKDGKYAQGWCWVGKERGKGWLQAELPDAAKIDRVVWSRDALNRYHDRFATDYRVDVSADGRAWRTVATGNDRAAPGHEPRVSRSKLVKALDASQRKKHQELLDKLNKLGVPRLKEVKSGPQVGEGVNGGFRALFLNGDERHVGKQRCPV
jgi:hypothetical protein